MPAPLKGETKEEQMAEWKQLYMFIWTISQRLPNSKLMMLPGRNGLRLFKLKRERYEANKVGSKLI
jgi:hypothetical protein